MRYLNYTTTEEFEKDKTMTKCGNSCRQCINAAACSENDRKTKKKPEASMTSGFGAGFLMDSSENAGVFKVFQPRKQWCLRF